MAVLKRGKRWWIELMVDGVRERGSVVKYAHLLPAGQPIPTTKDEAKKLEARVITWIANGRPAPPPPPQAPADPPPAERTIGEALEAYTEAHVAKMDDKSVPSIVRRMTRELGAYPARCGEAIEGRHQVAFRSENDCAGYFQCELDFARGRETVLRGDDCRASFTRPGAPAS